MGREEVAGPEEVVARRRWNWLRKVLCWVVEGCVGRGVLRHAAGLERCMRVGEGEEEAERRQWRAVRCAIFKTVYVYELSLLQLLSSREDERVRIGRRKAMTWSEEKEEEAVVYSLKCKRYWYAPKGTMPSTVYLREAILGQC
jgi:hypothetical protein